MSDEQMAINRLMCGNTAHSKNADYIQLAIKALEKQVPKKPEYVVIKHLNANIAFCPSCHMEFGGTEPNPDMLVCDMTYLFRKRNEVYCMGCGQKLDWSEWK